MKQKRIKLIRQDLTSRRGGVLKQLIFFFCSPEKLQNCAMSHKNLSGLTAALSAESGDDHTAASPATARSASRLLCLWAHARLPVTALGAEERASFSPRAGVRGSASQCSGLVSENASGAPRRSTGEEPRGGGHAGPTPAPNVDS